MKPSTITKWALITIMNVTPFVSFTQTNADSIYYNRLFYLCKAWGHVKYFHTGVANGSINGVEEFLTEMKRVTESKSKGEFKF